MKRHKHPRLRFFALHILIAIVIFTLIGFIVLRWLDQYTLHDQSISVPAFQTLTVSEAEDLATKHRLRITVMDSIYDDKAVPGTVLEQYPLNGERVKDNRMIYLTINASNPKLIAFPMLNNAPLRQTMQVLKTNGFLIGEISYAPSSFRHLVLKLQYKGEDIEPGALLYKGATIDIILGDGNNRSNHVPLPNVTGLRLNNAINTLKENYLNVGDIIGDNSIKNNLDRLIAIVYRQTPSPQESAQVQAGEAVRLYITQDTVKIQQLDSLLNVSNFLESR